MFFKWNKCLNLQLQSDSGCDLLEKWQSGRMRQS